MSRIILVHGAFNELWGPHELKARWLPALRDGLWHNNVEIDAEEVSVCFYGDLFRRTPGTDEDKVIEQSRAGIADALTNLAGEDAVAALSQAASDAAFDRTVDMVTIMATNAHLREQMRGRIEPLVSGETKVVVAHSLGTVLSYMALCNHPQWNIDTLVTLGSPLGQPMVQGMLDPKPPTWPNVRRWVNVRALGDKAAALPLAPVFGDRVEDVMVDNGHRAHAPEPYMNAAATGEAVAAALRA
jgi:pimeloyl-ACP methyl ester carboxylesterase